MYRNHKQSRLVIKALLCVAGIIALFFIVLTYKNYRMKEDKAPYVQVKEILPVMEALIEVNEATGVFEQDTNVVELVNRFTAQQYADERYLSFEELQMILQIFPVEVSDIIKDYKSNDWSVGLEDWNRILRLLIEKYGAGEVLARNILLLGRGENVANEEKQPLAEDLILTENGVLQNRYWNPDAYLFSNVEAVCYRDEILTMTDYADEIGILPNTYLVSISNEEWHFFWNGYHMTYPAEIVEDMTGKKKDGPVRIITDIGMDRGNVHIIREKEEYVHGKLLQVGDGFIEIEDYGTYPMDENMQVYKVFGELSSMNKSDLRIGYSFADYVIEEGKIAACLMIKEEDMEYIRVLIKNSDMAGRYHNEVSGYCNQECEVIMYEEGVEISRTGLQKEERFIINNDEVSGKRIKIVPSVLSAEITLESIRRNQGTPSYFGTLEITADEEGLLVVNEVLLEDYLCKVVPSEMPSSYPMDALMAQAVCARTYAYGKMLNAGLPALGAHVDDSAGFQVYNNIEEQASTTEAVKATHNRIAVYENVPIGAYYYSTSCGMGTDTGIWHGSEKSPEYLTATEIGVTNRNTQDEVAFADASVSAESLIQENEFKKWITDVKDSHYEAQEGWYRWSYDVKEIDVSHMEEVLKIRYQNNPNLILTKKDGQFEKCEIDKLGEITDIEIIKRLPGGVADELLITGTKATVKVISELNIRYVLSDGETKVKRQTEDEVAASATLPSAFIIIETIKEDDRVTGYMITGGGFGHGVGMSQNGAKNMAGMGMSYEEILTFFYPGTTIKTLQFEE